MDIILISIHALRAERDVGLSEIEMADQSIFQYAREIDVTLLRNCIEPRGDCERFFDGPGIVLFRVGEGIEFNQRRKIAGGERERCGA